MKKRIIIFSIILLILIIFISIGVNSFIRSFKRDQDETKIILSKIKDYYKDFYNATEMFSNKRTSFYELKEEYGYIEDIDNDPTKLENFMKEYESVVVNVNDKSSFLKGHCNITYSDYYTNNTCKLFLQGYEAVINYFITDVKVYNDLIDGYNEWHSNDEDFIKLSHYNFNLYDDYIDYDNDGNFLGGD